jgi:hypothetical protein
MSIVMFGLFMSAILTLVAFALSASDGDGLSSA